MRAPNPIDFNIKRDKKKEIVVVGGGMVGLTTAYYLAKNYPQNHVTVLEKNDQPMIGSSYQNGNLLPVDFCHSWMNVPIYPFVTSAVFDSKNFNSKVYCETFIESFANITVTAKFGLLWMLFQPNDDDYAHTTLKIQIESREQFLKFIETEGLHKFNDFGYVDNMQSAFLRRKEGGKGDWEEWMTGVEAFFPGQEKRILYRSKDPELYKKEIDDKVPHLKALG